MKSDRLGCLIVVAAFVAAILYIIAANAQDQYHPQDIHERFYSTWMMPDAPNTSCCHNQDCSPAPSRFVDGHWEAQRGSIWIPIPLRKVEQNRDSPDGRSHLCGRPGPIGEFTVFCFVRGSGT
ncbi:hypothetical protein [uncultured Bradyrhizobium sp.]|uniref:hypothetical protein n=1 Tax=uncultured Bradyrhizobium sp. TaxID=199684 RepID=UPI0035CB1F74